MAFLRSISTNTAPPVLRGDRVMLRTPVLGDYAQWAKLREESRAFLAPWEPIWPADDLTKLAFRRRMRRYQREIRNGTGYPFFVFSPDGDTLLGGLTLSQVQRGVTQSVVLGYWMGERYAGKGLMTSAVKTVSRFVFDTLHLNRIEAACLPTQRRLDPPPRKGRICPRGLRPQISVHRRPLAGSPAFRPGSRRSPAVIAAWDEAGPAGRFCLPDRRDQPSSQRFASGAWRIGCSSRVVSRSSFLRC